MRTSKNNLLQQSQKNRLLTFKTAPDAPSKAGAALFLTSWSPLLDNCRYFLRRPRTRPRNFRNGVKVGRSPRLRRDRSSVFIIDTLIIMSIVFFQHLPRDGCTVRNANHCLHCFRGDQRRTDWSSPIEHE